MMAGKLITKMTLCLSLFGWLIPINASACGPYGLVLGKISNYWIYNSDVTIKTDLGKTYHWNIASGAIYPNIRLLPYLNTGFSVSIKGDKDSVNKTTDHYNVNWDPMNSLTAHIDGSESYTSYDMGIYPSGICAALIEIQFNPFVRGYPPNHVITVGPY